MTEIEGGEFFGVIRKSSGTESDCLEDGDTGTVGARSSGWVVGVIPVTEGVLDINRDGGWENFLRGSSCQVLSRSFQ